MATHIALLRAINVGGRNRVAMADLRDLATGLGLRGAKTLLQSGNLVFDSDARPRGELESIFEVEAKKRLGLEIDFIVRTFSEWDSAIAQNPFLAEAVDDPSHLVVLFTKQHIEIEAVEALQAAIKGREVARHGGKHVYIVYPDGIGDSKLTNAVIEAKLKCRGTARNWNTVLKLAEMAK